MNYLIFFDLIYTLIKWINYIVKWILVGAGLPALPSTFVELIESERLITSLNIQ